jgi:hypothetical protein
MLSPSLAPVPRDVLREALSDGVVTLDEERAVESAVERGIVSWDATLLVDQYFNNRKQFSTESAAAFDRFVDARLPQIVRLDPANGRAELTLEEEPAVHNTSAQYRDLPGSLFVDGVSLLDAVQGQAGDCYLISAMNALSLTQPRAIEDAIREIPGGYEVTFYTRKTEDGPFEPVRVPVTDDLPWGLNQIFYAKGRDRSELWPGIIEKAYAKWKGTYKAIARGGEMSASLAALTGKPSQFAFLSPATDTAALFDRLKTALAAGAPIVAGSRGYGDNAPFEHRDVVFGHAYAVTRLFEQDGVRYVELLNPWGFATSTSPEGRLTLTLDQLIALFSEICWV